jgi:hypothetical protein
MKKFMTLAAILAALTLTVTGCSKGNESSSDVTSEAGSSTVESTVEAGTSDEGASDTENESALTALNMAANALAATEWPAMMEIPDAETASMLLGIDVSLCEDYYLSTQLMSAQLNVIIVVKPSAGNEAAVKEQLDAHFAYIKDGAAFYPAQEESAAGSVQGETEDGYMYIIVHAEGATIADSLLTNPPAEMPSVDEAVPEEDMGGMEPMFPMSLTMADAAYAAVEWPSMMPVDDPELALSFFGIDTALCEDYYIANQLISAQLNEIIIVKPVAGAEADIQAQLEAHFEYIKTDAAFYPEQEPSAEGAVMGELDNGYKYIFVHEFGSVVADAVAASILA